ncbi:MAG: diphthamide biosynthesis enzyme Dph2 [Candidatus Nezhaarchaeales archaeon]
MYDLRVNDVLSFVRREGVKRLLLQFADGLKHYASLVYEELSERAPDVEVLTSGSSCYGACDVAFEEALNVKADGIVHYGHTPFPETFSYAEKLGIKVFFVEAFLKLDVSKVIDKALDSLSSMSGLVNVGLTATLQEAHYVPVFKRHLEEEGFRVHVGTGSNKVRYAGQVLGCDYSSALSINDNVEVFLHLGGGLFHAIGLGLVTQKPVLLCDPYRNEVMNIEREVKRVKSARLYSVVKSMENAKRYCIVVGCKWRQRHMYSAMKIKGLLEKKGKKVSLMTLYEVSPQALDNLPEPDSFVITACPRIPIDDYMNYKRPILTVLEALIVAGELKLEEWSLCDWVLNEKATSNAALKS